MSMLESTLPYITNGPTNSKYTSGPPAKLTTEKLTKARLTLQIHLWKQLLVDHSLNIAQNVEIQWQGHMQHCHLQQM